MKMHPRLPGRTLQGVGATLMIVALAGALGTGAWANANFLAPLRQVLAIAPAASPGASPTPAPSPSAGGLPSATPTPKTYEVRRGGRLQMSLSGSLSFGARSNSQTLTDVGAGQFGPSPSASPSPSSIVTTQSQASGGVGMQAELTRRTAGSSFDLRVPFGFTTGSKAQVGSLNLFYSTPRYGIGYGGQTVTILGQLPLGSTLRGGYLVLPVYRGDLTFIQGPTVGAGGEIIPMNALRYRAVRGGAIFEAAVMNASGPLTGKSQTELFGAAVTRGQLTSVGEIAFQSRPGGDTTPSGPSYQFRIDDGGLRSYLTILHRHLSDGFLAIGAGESTGDDYWDFGYRRSGTTSSSFDTSVQKLGSGIPGISTTTHSTNVSFGGPYRFGSYTLNAQSTTTRNSETPDQWQGTAGAQATASLGRGFAFFSAQLGRQTSGSSDPLANVSLTSQYQLPLGSFSTGFSYGFSRQLQSAGNTTQITKGLYLSRQFRKTGLSVNESFQRSMGALTDAFARNTQFIVTRQISPAISISAGYQLSALTDRLNPGSNGKTSAFNIQINAPFSFGNGIVSGRADPHLPATIYGRVISDISSNNPTFSSLVSNGLNNVQVVLDDTIVQRTDLSGSFQFSFVSPGQHQIRIESSSLPRGLTVDIPVFTLRVDGGQTAQVTFLVGTFGGIQGHVYGRDDHGTIIPLPNVLLRVDGGTYSQTDSTGTYGFGRLRPGKHEVTVIENSVPAFASFDPKNEKATVEVKNGVYTDLDFSAEPLGSIEGTVTYAPDMSKEANGGVENAYVVAEPGEHAAIVDADGSFNIDNLPPGDYTVSVDSETIPEGLGAGPESISVSLGSHEHYQGAKFLVGHTQKKVVFSFTAGGSEQKAGLPKVRLSEDRLPPRGTATITVDAPKSAGSVVASAFGTDFTLAYNEGRALWAGRLTVPTNAKAGSYDVTAKVASGTQPQASSVTVDAKMPIAIMIMEPPNPVKGQYVRVRARFLVDAAQGDRIQWEDGQVTTLGRPLTGRVFTFNLRYSLRPLHGLLLTRVGSLPISLM